MSDFTLPDANGQVLLVERPGGVPSESDFRVVETEVPRPGEGKFLVRNLYLSVDAAQKGWAGRAANYSAPVPLSSVMRGLGVGRIVKSRHPEFPVDAFVYGWTGWQDYSVLGPGQVLTLIDTPQLPLSAYAGVLGINGMTAWLAFNDLGRPKAGETLLVTTAAGAVGSIVGQLARAQGCRTLGLAGNAEKVAKCLELFGFDTAANYKSETLPPEFKAGLTDGIDIFFDNTGGALLDRYLRLMSLGGRIVQCGTASVEQWDPVPHGPRNEREVLMRRLSWNGFVIFDHQARFAATQRALADMVRSGALVYEEDVRHGLAEAPGALAILYRGENEGKLLIAT